MSFVPASQISIVPSILNADFGHLAKQIEEAEKAGVDGFHLDIMDGHFVPNISFGPDICAHVNKMTEFPLDVHLMISNPDFFIQQFADAGADSITIHQETCPDIRQIIEKIHSHGIDAGVSINPDTPVEVVSPVIGEIELVLIMSVHPGFGGQKFIPKTIDKLSTLQKIRKGKNPELLVQVDGGLDLTTIPAVVRAGTNVLVIGSAIFKQPDIALTVDSFRQIIKNHEF